MIIAIFYFLGLIVGVIGVFMHQAVTVSVVAAELLKWYFLISIGFSLMFAGIIHALKGDFVARRLKWPVGSPFQKEVGYWDFAAGVMAVFAFWRHGEFWLAVTIINVIFWTLAGILHVYEWAKNRNRQIDNALPAIMNLVVAATLLVLYFFTARI
jgi:hypothetical protein